MAQLVKNPPATQETWVRSLVWEDPLEKGKATHPSILAWRIPWTVQSMGSHTTERLSLSLSPTLKLMRWRMDSCSAPGLCRATPPFTQHPLPGKPWHSPHVPSEIVSLLPTQCAWLSGAPSPEGFAECFPVPKRSYTQNQLYGESARGFPQARTKMGEIFISSQTRLNRRGMRRVWWGELGAVSKYYECFFLQKIKKHYGVPSQFSSFQ